MAGIKSFSPMEPIHSKQCSLICATCKEVYNLELIFSTNKERNFDFTECSNFDLIIEKIYTFCKDAIYKVISEQPLIQKCGEHFYHQIKKNSLAASKSVAYMRQVAKTYLIVLDNCNINLEFHDIFTVEHSPLLQEAIHFQLKSSPKRSLHSDIYVRLIKWTCSFLYNQISSGNFLKNQISDFLQYFPRFERSLEVCEEDNGWIGSATEFVRFLKTEQYQLSMHCHCHKSIKNYERLKFATFCRLFFINGFLCSGLDTLKVSDWLNAKKHADKSLYSPVCINEFKLIVSSNENLKYSLILIPKSCFEHLDILANARVRRSCNIDLHNTFLFPKIDSICERDKVLKEFMIKPEYNSEILSNNCIKFISKYFLQADLNLVVHNTYSNKLQYLEATSQCLYPDSKTRQMIFKIYRIKEGSKAPRVSKDNNVKEKVPRCVTNSNSQKRVMKFCSFCNNLVPSKDIYKHIKECFKKKFYKIQYLPEENISVDSDSSGTQVEDLEAKDSSVEINSDPIQVDPLLTPPSAVISSQVISLHKPPLEKTERVGKRKVASDSAKNSSLGLNSEPIQVDLLPTPPTSSTLISSQDIDVQKPSLESSKKVNRRKVALYSGNTPTLRSSSRIRKISEEIVTPTPTVKTTQHNIGMQICENLSFNLKCPPKLKPKSKSKCTKTNCYKNSRPRRGTSRKKKSKSHLKIQAYAALIRGDEINLPPSNGEEKHACITNLECSELNEKCDFGQLPKLDQEYY